MREVWRKFYLPRTKYVSDCRAVQIPNYVTPRDTADLPVRQWRLARTPVSNINTQQFMSSHFIV